MKAGGGEDAPCFSGEKVPATNRYKVNLSHHITSMMKHLYPDGNGLFQSDNSPAQKGNEGSPLVSQV